MGVEKNRDSGVSKLCTIMSLAFLGIWAGHIYNGLSERHIPGIDPIVIRNSRSKYRSGVWTLDQTKIGESSRQSPMLQDCAMKHHCARNVVTPHRPGSSIEDPMWRYPNR